MDAPRRRLTARRVARAVGLSTAGTGGFAIVFVGAVALGVSLHAQVPAFRRTAGFVGNRVMSGLFEGRLVVTDVTALSIGRRGRLRARAVEITDPDGKRVIHATDIEGDIDLVKLVDNLVTTGGAHVDLAIANVGTADVILERDASGTPTIARAFTPRPKPEALPRPGAKKAPPPVLHVRSATVGHAHVHGNIVPPELDADADDVRARFDLEDDVAKVTLDGGRVTLRSPRAPNQKAPVVGSASGQLAVTLADKTLRGEARFDGACGGIPIVAHARIDGEDVEASVDVARTDPEALGAALADLPFTKPIEVHARARGKLPTLALEARAKVDASELVATGEIDLREGRAFKLDVDASRVDARAYGADAETDLSAKVHAEGSLAAAGPLGTFRVVSAAGSAAGQPVPAATIEGRFDPKRVTATFRASEPGVTVTGKASLVIPSKVVTFDVQGRSDSLASLARAPGVVHGAASVRAQGKVDLTDRTIDATANVSGEGIATGSFSAGRLAASGIISGPIAAPIADVGFSGVDVALHSPDKEPLVYPTAHGHAKVALSATPRIVDASVSVSSPAGGEGITASAANVTIARGSVEARGVTVTGLGEPVEIDADLSPGQWRVRAKGAQVDLRRAAALGGIKKLEDLPKGAAATLDVDVRQDASGANGHLDVVVTAPPGTFGPGAITGEVHAKVERSKLTGTARLAADGFGQIEVTRADLDVPERLDGRALARTTGTLEIRGAFDLSQGAALFAGDAVERMAGIAYLEARIERGDPDKLPLVRGTVRTDGLEVAYSTDPAQPTTLVSGIDLLAHASWDGGTEDAEVALLGWDKGGVLGSASVKSRVPLGDWISGKEKVDGDALGRLEVDGVVDLPERELARLPEVFRLRAVRGSIDGRIRVSGSVDRPTVIVSGHARNVREDRRGTSQASSLAPLDGTLEGRWDGERAAITFAIDERRTRAPRRRAQPPAGANAALADDRRRRGDVTEPGHLRGLVLLSDIRMRDVLEGKKLTELPWRASTEVEVEDLDLGALALGGRDLAVGGMLSGRARVRDLNHEPSFEASGRIEDFRASDATVAKVEINAGGRDRSLFAHASITDDKTQATIQLASQSLRLRGVEVDWDPKAATRVDYLVQNGRVALVAPLVKSAVSEIDGRVDGAGSISIDDKGQVFEGGLALREGHLYVNAIGEEMTGLTATARFDKSGTWRIEHATGKIGGGEFEAAASGKMDGLSFVSASATLKATKEGVPISAEGATFAEATGEVHVDARMNPERKRLELDVDIKRADVQLPDRGTQQLEPLEADPTITVGFRRANGVLDPSIVKRSRGGRRVENPNPAAVSATRLTVALGDEVRIEGNGLDVALGGRTVVDIANEIAVTGRLDLKSGTIIVHGRRFTVDRGVITFQQGESPGNPTVVAAAYWDAPDRTRVWVEFVGPLKSGKLTLRSEPPYSKNEILSVLLFGRPDPNQAVAGSGSANHGSGDAGATAVGTGFVAGDLNRMLAELDENLDIETDTLGGNRTRTKLGRSFFDRRLKVQVGYAPGRTYREPDTTFVFLNWQFVPKWSLQGTRGDRGTSILDVIFQHRY